MSPPQDLKHKSLQVECESAVCETPLNVSRWCCCWCWCWCCCCAVLCRLSLGAKLTVGTAIRVRVLACDSKKKHLRCSSLVANGDAAGSANNGPVGFMPGAVVLCRLREAARATVDQALRVQVRGVHSLFS